MTHVTHEQAYDALCDPDVKIEDAYRLFQQAHRRSNKATKAFTIGTSMAIRVHAMEQREKSVFDADQKETENGYN